MHGHLDTLLITVFGIIGIYAMICLIIGCFDNWLQK